MSGLAELNLLLNAYGDPTALDQQIRRTQELLALLPDADEVVSRELAVLENCSAELKASHGRLAQLLASAEQEFLQILDHVSSEDWFNKQLLFSEQQRNKWLCHEQQIQDLLLTWSLIEDTWKYPMAVINVQHDRVLEVCNSCYLLYMIDIDRDLLIEKYNSFENSVQPRIKYHTIPKWTEPDWETKLGLNQYQMHWGVPTEQMALVVVWNLFERFNAWAAKQFLIKTKQLLRPGGKILFNMFDASSSNAAAFITDGKIGGMTKSQVQTIAQELGLELGMWSKHGSDLVTVILQDPAALQSDKIKWPLGIIKKS